MMQLCQSHDCTSWAQWRVTGDTDRKKDIVLKLCQRHKIEVMAAPILKDQKAVFAGAMPDVVGVR